MIPRSSTLEVSPHWFGVVKPGHWVALFDGRRFWRAAVAGEPQETLNVLDGRSIADLGGALCQSLEQAGVLGPQAGGLEIGTARQRETRLQWNGPLEFRLVGHGAHARVLAAALAPAHREPTRTPSAHGPAPAGPGSPDVPPHRHSVVCLFVSDHFWDGRLPAELESCRRQGLALLPVLPAGNRLWVGPWLHPRRGPCLQCFIRRRVAHHALNEETAGLFSLLYRSQMPRILAPIVDEGFLQAFGSAMKVIDEMRSEPPEGFASPVAVVDMDSGEVTSSWLLPVAGCPCDARPPVRLTPMGPDLLRDPLLGLVRTFGEIVPQPLSDQLSIVACSSVDLLPLRSVVNQSPAQVRMVIGGGVARRPETATQKALSELVERASLSFEPTGVTSPRSYDQLGEDAVPPSFWVLFSEDQYQSASFPFARFDEQTPVRWCRSERLRDGRPVLVPLALVQGQAGQAPGEVSIGHYSTSGVAAHLDEDRAIRSGLWELIERDAILVTWLARIPTFRVVVSPRLEASTPALADARVYRGCLERSGFLVESYRLQTDLPVAVVITVAFRTNGQRPRFAFGAGARLLDGEAYVRSLEEACQFLAWDEEGIPERFDPGREYQDVRGFLERYLLYNNEDMWPHLDVLRRAQAEREITLRPASRHEHPRDILLDHGFDPIIVDLTFPDARAADRVVRACLVPGLHPVNADHRFPYGNCRRLISATRAIGRDFDIIEANDLPHPIP